MKLPNPCFAILSPIMCDFPSEELRNEGKRFLWGGPTVPPFFVGDKRPVGLPDISRGMEIQQGTPPSCFSLRSSHKHSFLFSLQSFTRAGKKHWHKTEAQKSKMDGSFRYILLLPNFFAQSNVCFAKNLYGFKRNERAVRRLHTPVI